MSKKQKYLVGPQAYYCQGVLYAPGSIVEMEPKFASRTWPVVDADGNIKKQPAAETVEGGETLDAPPPMVKDGNPPDLRQFPVTGSKDDVGLKGGPASEAPVIKQKK